MDVVKFKTPENVCPVIDGGWEDVRWGGGEGAKWPTGGGGFIPGTTTDPLAEGDLALSGVWGKSVTGDIVYFNSQEDWFGPSIIEGTESLIEGGGMGGIKELSIDGPPDGKIEGDYGFGGTGEGKKPVTGDIKPGLIDDGGDGLDHEWYIDVDWGFSGDGPWVINGEYDLGGWDARDTNIPKHEVPKRGDDQYDAAADDLMGKRYTGLSGDWGFSGGWDPRSGDWGLISGDDDGAEELFDIGGGSSNIGGSQLGIILKVEGSTEHGGIIKTGSRIPVIWKDGSSWFGPIFWKSTEWLSGEGLLIGDVEESINNDPWVIDGGDHDIGHTCPFMTPGFDGHTSTFGEKDFGVQPRT